MNIDTFQDILRGEVKKNRTSERTESSSFLIWFLENFFNLDRNEAIQVVCDNNKDKGIDAIYVDEIEEIIYVFQSKFKENNDRHVGDKVLRDFSGVKEWFKSSETISKLETSTINQELKMLINNNKLADIINEYSVEFHFVTNAQKNTDTEEYLKVNNDVYVWDLETLMRNYYDIKDDPLVMHKHTFQGLNVNKVIEYPLDSGLKTIIVPIKATELIELKGINDMTLFNKNVRYGLGSTRVNKSIKRTLQSNHEKKNFLLFHNGISMVCEKYNYDLKRSELMVENYSIVNGAQSILSFYNNSIDLTDSVTVLLKVSAVGDDRNLMTLISKYNNNQNSISMRDLRSNDKIQNRITKDFERISGLYGVKLVYSAKRGKSIPAGYVEIASDYAGQLIESCYLGRPYNTHLKASMFDNRYNEVFNKNINATKITMYFKSHLVLTKMLDKIVDDNIADYGLTQHFLLSALYRLFDEDETISKLLDKEENYFQNINAWDKVVEKCLSIIIMSFNKHIKKLKANSNFIYKNFFKSKESAQNMLDDVIGDFRGLMELQDTSLVAMIKENKVID